MTRSRTRLAPPLACSVLAICVAVACAPGEDDAARKQAAAKEAALHAEVAAMQKRLQSLEGETHRLRRRLANTAPARAGEATSSDAVDRQGADLPPAGPVQGRARLMRERLRRLAALRAERRTRLNDVYARCRGNPYDPQCVTDVQGVEAWFRAERAHLLARRSPQVATGRGRGDGGSP